MSRRIKDLQSRLQSKLSDQDEIDHVIRLSNIIQRGPNLIPLTDVLNNPIRIGDIVLHHNFIWLRNKPNYYPQFYTRQLSPYLVLGMTPGGNLFLYCLTTDRKKYLINYRKNFVKISKDDLNAKQLKILKNIK